jgi:hypothetical protein
MTKSGMPWETGATEGKYRYHPGGDGSAAPKDAPSAVNVVVVPDVNLPKVRICTSSQAFKRYKGLPSSSPMHPQFHSTLSKKC